MASLPPRPTGAPTGAPTLAGSTNRPNRDSNPAHHSVDQSPRSTMRGRGGHATRGHNSVPPLAIPEGNPISFRGNGRRRGRGGYHRGTGASSQSPATSRASVVTSSTTPCQVPSPTEPRHRSPRADRGGGHSKGSTLSHAASLPADTERPEGKCRKRSKQKGNSPRGKAPSAMASSPKPVLDLRSRLSEAPDTVSSATSPILPDQEALSKRYDLDLLVQHVHERALASTPSGTKHFDWADDDDDDDSLPDISHFITHSQSNASKPGEGSTNSTIPRSNTSGSSHPEPIKNQKAPSDTHFKPVELQSEIQQVVDQVTPDIAIVTEIQAAESLKEDEDDAVHAVAESKCLVSMEASQKADDLAPESSEHIAMEETSAILRGSDELKMGPMSLETMASSARAFESELSQPQTETKPRGLEPSSWTPANHRKQIDTHQRAHTTHATPSKDLSTLAHQPRLNSPPTQHTPLSPPRFGGANFGHSRNHSSPLERNSRTKSISRPVLTGDALSRLARSITGRPSRGTAAAIPLTTQTS